MCVCVFDLQSVTHINPQFEMRRETVKSGVFQPGHRLPTMSLEEYADMEMADAQERQKREQYVVFCLSFRYEDLFDAFAFSLSPNERC